MLQAVAPRGFAPWHKSDRIFFPLWVALIWAAILLGFVPDVIRHIRLHQPAYPIIVHFHALAFVGWLVLLTVQLGLIRTNRVALHRKLGVLGAALALIMIVLGPVTAFIVDHAAAGTPRADPAFLAIQLLDIVGFAGLVIAAILFRHRSSAHKRLILLATIYLTDAGFGRWLAGLLHAPLGDSFLAFMTEMYIGADLLVLGMGAYDLATRGRLNPIYLPAVAWILLVQLTTTYLYLAPWWKTAATAMIGH